MSMKMKAADDRFREKGHGRKQAGKPVKGQAGRPFGMETTTACYIKTWFDFMLDYLPL
jgi:hypothetical protein